MDVAKFRDPGPGGVKFVCARVSWPARTRWDQKQSHLGEVVQGQERIFVGLVPAIGSHPVVRPDGRLRARQLARPHMRERKTTAPWAEPSPAFPARKGRSTSGTADHAQVPQDDSGRRPASQSAARGPAVPRTSMATEPEECRRCRTNASRSPPRQKRTERGRGQSRRKGPSGSRRHSRPQPPCPPRWPHEPAGPLGPH